MLNSVNHERAKVGAQKLCFNNKLMKAAENHNNDMYNNNRLTHTGSDGSQPWDCVKRVGYAWSEVSDNVAQGDRSVDQVMKSWMNSSGHRRNILDGKVKYLGVAWHKSGNYWT